MKCSGQPVGRGVVFALILSLGFLSWKPVQAEVVVVMFTGFNPGAFSGMDMLNADLQGRFDADFPDLNYQGQVFAYDDRGGALNFVNGFAKIDKMFLVGHSFGGNALIQFAELDLMPAGALVDASFQLDSVDIFFGPGSGILDDDVLPANVVSGFNYYQNATGFLEPQGERFVLGATNIDAEELFNDPSITHTSIDNDLRIYDEIYAGIQAALIPKVLLGDVNGDGSLNLLDVAPFVDLIATGSFQVEADMNGDGAINLLDVSLFVDLVAGG